MLRAALFSPSLWPSTDATSPAGRGAGGDAGGDGGEDGGDGGDGGDGRDGGSGSGGQQVLHLPPQVGHESQYPQLFGVQWKSDRP